jgi:hypothetical protein
MLVSVQEYVGDVQEYVVGVQELINVSSSRD